MAHKTLIGGTAYDISGGREMIGGTGYAKKKGRVLVNGTGYDIPFSSGIPLSTVALGDILMLNENGSPIPFYVCKHDYESGLNGAGRTLLVRKDCGWKKPFSDKGNNAFTLGSTYTWLNDTWLKMLSQDVQEAAGKTTIYYTFGKALTAVDTMQCAVFLLSGTEMGQSRNTANVEGTALDSPVINKLLITNLGSTDIGWWTRSPNKTSNWEIANYIGVSYNTYYDSWLGTYIVSNSLGIRPAFTLPSTFPVIQNPDGTYSPAA